MSSKFHTVDRDTLYLLPPSVQDWLPDDHLARFVVDIVERLDLSALERRYSGGGKDPYHPSLLLGLLFYGYATGVFSSRKLEPGDLRFGGLPVYCGERPPGSRHDCEFPQAFSQGVCKGCSYRFFRSRRRWVC